jgi:hypothetical protein
MSFFSRVILVLLVLFALPAFAEEGGDPRPLTAEELQTFLPLACPAPRRTPHGDYLCKKLNDYPPRNDVDPRTEKTIDLLTISYGDFTGTAIKAAYITYASSIETRASNFGGGLLFVYNVGKPGEVSRWQLLRWFPGRQMNHCLAFPPEKGPQRMLCLVDWGGKGEENSMLRVESLLSYPTILLRAYDSRGAGSMHVECRDVPAKPLPLAIRHLQRAKNADEFAEVTIAYATPEAISAACKKSGFDSLKEEVLKLRFALKGTELVPLNSISFAAPNYSRY